MSEHEFRSEQPVSAPSPELLPGECAPQGGSFGCASCAEAVTATLITLEKDDALPICHTCGPMTRWVQRS